MVNKGFSRLFAKRTSSCFKKVFGLGFSQSAISNFLDASSYLYNRVCPSVGRSFCPSVRPSVRPSILAFLPSRSDICRVYGLVYSCHHCHNIVSTLKFFSCCFSFFFISERECAFGILCSSLYLLFFHSGILRRDKSIL